MIELRLDTGSMRFKTLSQGITHKAWDQYRIDIYAIESAVCPNMDGNMLMVYARREGTVYSGYVRHNMVLGRIDLREDGILLKAKLGEIPRLIMNFFKTKDLLNIRM